MERLCDEPGIIYHFFQMVKVLMQHHESLCKYFFPLSIVVLYMAFDGFLLAVESRDLSQADESLIRGFFSKVVSFLAVINE